MLRPTLSFENLRKRALLFNAVRQSHDPRITDAAECGPRDSSPAGFGMTVRAWYVAE